MKSFPIVAVVMLLAAGCAHQPPQDAVRPSDAPDYPTTTPGLVTIAALTHHSDVAVIAPDVEHVIWKRGSLDASAVSDTGAKTVVAERARADACPDSDGDGVCNSQDRCQGTPRGERVDKIGCSCEITATLQFAFDSAELTAQDKQTLEAIAGRLKALQHVELEVIGYADRPLAALTGHTDSIGTEEYNLDLSQRRARAAATYLTSQGIAGARLTTIGKGESAPIADNATDAGRAQNRRVVITRAGCAPQP